MAKAEAKVSELVGMIERGELRLPEMQRRYVWRATRVRDLLDSLYRGYPSGAILLWDTDEEVPERAFSVGQAKNAYASTRLLLDGQQRLTSLSAVIRGEPIAVRNKKRPIEILFNLDHPEGLQLVTEVDEEGENDEDDDQDDADDGADDTADANEDQLLERFKRMTFVVASRKLEAQPNWVKVSDVFKTDSDSGFLKRVGIKEFDDPRVDLYSKRLAKLRGIKNYIYRMDILERELSYEEVTEIFVRVNSLGAKLRSSDLALAQITAKWKGALATFQKLQDDCEKLDFDIDIGLLIKNLVVFATGQSRFLTVNRLSVGTLKSAWEESVKGMKFAVDFLRSNVKIESPALLSSTFILISLARLGQRKEYEFSSVEQADLRRWVLLANAKGRYSRGSSETLLDQDIKSIDDGHGIAALLERLRVQVGSLEFEAGELEGRNQRSAIFKTMFLAFRAAGAKDWRSNVEISLRHGGAQNRIQFHHIFPKAYLKEKFGRREVDDIANLAFIGGSTNQKLSDKPPKDYFPKVIEKSPDTFLAQCVPTDPILLSDEKYREFLQARRQKIAVRLNEFLS